MSTTNSVTTEHVNSNIVLIYKNDKLSHVIFMQSMGTMATIFPVPSASYEHVENMLYLDFPSEVVGFLHKYWGEDSPARIKRFDMIKKEVDYAWWRMRQHLNLLYDEVGLERPT